MATEIIRPTGAGDTTECTPSAGANWDCVEEAPHDADGTYVISTAGDGDVHDLYAAGNPASIGGADVIDSVRVTVVSRESAGAQGQIAPCLKENGTTTKGTLVAITTSYTAYSETWYLRPSDSGPWTLADLNALQIGVRQNAISGTVRTTQVRAHITYQVGRRQVILIMPQSI